MGLTENKLQCVCVCVCFRGDEGSCRSVRQYGSLICNCWFVQRIVAFGLFIGSGPPGRKIKKSADSSLMDTSVVIVHLFVGLQPLIRARDAAKSSLLQQEENKATSFVDGRRSLQHG